jgi:hypothetical protein
VLHIGLSLACVNASMAHNTLVTHVQSLKTNNAGTHGPLHSALWCSCVESTWRGLVKPTLCVTCCAEWCAMPCCAVLCCVA